VNKFLQSKHCNVRHEGLYALECLMRAKRLSEDSSTSGGSGDSNPVEAVLTCADHFDPSIQRKAFSLLCSLANKDSIKVHSYMSCALTFIAGCCYATFKLT